MRTEPPASASGPRERPPPALISAQAVVLPAPVGELRHAVYLVFDAQLAPSSLVPQRVLVMREDGGRSEPLRVTLAPASEGDENRTLTLELVAPAPAAGAEDAGAEDGDLGAALAPELGARPRSVVITGLLHAEDGRTIEGLSAEVIPPGSPPRLLLTERLAPGPGRCEGAGGLVRTYWSIPVRPGEGGPGVSLALAGGAASQPVGLDDLDEGASGGGRFDNVIDLCVAAGDAVTSVQAPAAAFVDASGVASAPASLAVPGDPRTPPTGC